MAKQRKNKNTNKKRGASKKLDKKSTNQKENKPKKTKVTKPSPEETIPMSKQMLVKKKVQSNSRAKLQSTSTTRVCGNGIPMPSLDDLEKMFENSDDENEKEPVSNALTELQKRCVNSDVVSNDNSKHNCITPQKQVPIIDIDLLFSPTTRTRIIEQVKEIINLDDSDDCLQDIANQPPPKKRLKLERDISKSDHQHAHTAYDDLCITNNEADGQINSYNKNQSCQSKRKQSIYISETNEKLREHGNISDDSCDSNKTIEYKTNPSTSQAFSPLPSTSKDSQTFIKNDELFNKSLIESSNMDIKLVEDDNDLMIIDIPPITILIDEEGTNDEPHDNKNTENVNNSNVFKSKDQNNSATVKADTEKDDYGNDDDCMFVKIEHNTSNHKSKSNQTDAAKQENQPLCNIDLESYDFNDPLNNIDNNYNIEDEIIDVDALIAQNQTILSQYNRPEPTNFVVDVDVSTLADKPLINSNIGSLDRLIGMQQHISVTEPGFYRKITNQNHANEVTCKSINNQNTPRQTNKDFQRLASPQETIQHPGHNVSNIVTGNSRKSPDLEASNQQENNTASNSLSTLSSAITILGDTISEVHTNTKDIIKSRNISNVPRPIMKDLQRHDSPQVTSQHPVYIVSNNSNNTPNLPGSNQQNYSTLHDTISSEVINFFQRNYNPPNNLHQNNSVSSFDFPHMDCLALASARHGLIATWSPNSMLSSSQRPQNISGRTTQNVRLSVPTSMSESSIKARKRKRKSPIASNMSLCEDAVQTPKASSGNLGDCPICLDSLSGNTIGSTICGHVFCMSCLQIAIKSNKRCPTCRKILKNNGYHQIFL